MSGYRRMIYRYSTGEGPIVNVGLPTRGTDYASFKMDPLQYNLKNPGMAVDLKREADRLSMQVEAADQMIKVLGYNGKAGDKYRKLRGRVELIKHLLINYPVKYIKSEDLERLYDLYAKSHPAMDSIIEKVIGESSKLKGSTPDFVGTAYSVRKGYPMFDAYGKILSPPDKELFEKTKAGAAKTLSGFDGLPTGKLPILLAVGALAYYIFVHKKAV